MHGARTSLAPIIEGRKVLMKTHRIINFIELFSVAFIIVGLFTFAHVCDGMEGMTPICFITKKWAIIFGVILIVLSVIQLVVKNKGIHIALSITQFISGIVMILLPIVIAPVCQMKSMHCYVYTRPLLVIAGIVISIIVFVDFLIALLSIRGEKDENLS